MADACVVVCGATGKQGGAVVDALLRRGHYKVRAVVRKPDRGAALAARGVELVQGDLTDSASLERAFTGATAVFGVTQPWSSDYRHADVTKELEQGLSLIAAVERAQVDLVLSTVLLVDHEFTGIPHVDSKIRIERAAERLGNRRIVLGPGSFLDNIGLPWYPVRPGKVRGFVDGDAKVPLVACHDIGEAAAALFERFPAYAGRRVNLIDGLYSGEDICAALSRLRGGLRGGEVFKWSAPPKWAMRLFAGEFYKMRVAFERAGRPPFPPEYDEALRVSLELLGHPLTLDEFLKLKGFDTRRLG